MATTHEAVGRLDTEPAGLHHAGASDLAQPLDPALKSPTAGPCPVIANSMPGSNSLRRNDSRPDKCPPAGVGLASGVPVSPEHRPDSRARSCGRSEEHT